MRGDGEISNSDKVIDSRDVIERIQYLEDERNTLEEAVTDANNAITDLDPVGNEEDETQAESDVRDMLADAQAALKEWDEGDEGKELVALKALADEAEGCGDWAHGETLIADSYFTEYAEELASDIGDYDPRNVRWPYTCIDWEKAADELKQDYTSVDFDGETYWIRG